MDVEEDLMIYGDPDKLARVFDNILRNAIAYCYANTEIRIEAKIKDGDIEITFTNAGDKIPAIAHCNCEERAKEVQRLLKERFAVKSSFIVDTSGISTVYANDGGIIVVV